MSEKNIEKIELHVSDEGKKSLIVTYDDKSQSKIEVTENWRNQVVLQPEEDENDIRVYVDEDGYWRINDFPTPIKAEKPRCCCLTVIKVVSLIFAFLFILTSFVISIYFAFVAISKNCPDNAIFCLGERTIVICAVPVISLVMFVTACILLVKLIQFIVKHWDCHSKDKCDDFTYSIESITEENKELKRKLNDKNK